MGGQMGGQMAAGVNLLQLFDTDLGVNGRGIEFFVSKQLLDEPDVGPVLEKFKSVGLTRSRKV